MASRRRSALIGVAALVAVGATVASGVVLWDGSRQLDEVRSGVEAPTVIATAEVSAGPAVGWLTGRANRGVGGSAPIELRSGGLAVDPVITWSSDADADIAFGEPILNLGSRPVLLLEGSATMYRDLYRGDRGPDVDALLGGLRSLGYQVGAEDEITDWALVAFADLRARAGADPQAISAADEQGLETMRSALGEQERLMAEERSPAVAAQRRLADQAATAQAEAAVASAELALRRAEEDRSASLAQIASAAGSGGGPGSLPPEASASSEGLRRSGDRMVEDARRHVVEQQRALANTRAGIAAEAAVSAERDRQAAERIAQSRSELEEAERRLRFTIRASDVVFSEVAPVQLDNRSEGGASDLSGLTLGSSSEVIVGRLSSSTISVSPAEDARVELLAVSEDGQRVAAPIAARVGDVGPVGPVDDNASSDGSGDHVFEVVPDQPDAAVGQTSFAVRVEYSVGDETSVNVPASAVRLTAAGTSVVRRMDESGDTDEVEVRVVGEIAGRIALVGVSADGGPGPLEPGQRVVVSSTDDDVAAT